MVAQNSSGGGMERRRHLRLDYNIPVKISSDDGDIVTETTNLSCSGAFCRIAKYLAPMTKLKINLLLPIRKNDRIVTKRVGCQGVVVRSESVPGAGFNTAIFFNDIAPRDSQIINDFVQLAIEQKTRAS